MPTLHVTGMTCHNCVKHVTQALQAVPGVTQVQVDLATGRAQVEGGEVPELLHAVQEEGYEVQLA